MIHFYFITGNNNFLILSIFPRAVVGGVRVGFVFVLVIALVFVACCAVPQAENLRVWSSILRGGKLLSLYRVKT
jgi:hypothetical protein